MSSPPWFPFYHRDYLSDTRRLSTVEHGAYLLLLMEQWNHGSLPDDDQRLAQIALMRIDHWRKIAPTIRAFFESAGDGTIRQKRMARERQKSAEVQGKRTNSATIRWEKQKAEQEAKERAVEGANSLESDETDDANAYAHGYANGIQSDMHMQTHTHTHTQDKKELPPIAPRKRRARAREYTEGFEIFWDLYPRKENKPRAFQEYGSALSRKATHDLIMACLDKAIVGPWLDKEEKFIPHPSTWLRSDPWDQASVFEKAKVESLVTPKSNQPTLFGT